MTVREVHMNLNRPRRQSTVASVNQALQIDFVKDRGGIEIEETDLGYWIVRSKYHFVVAEIHL